MASKLLQYAVVSFLILAIAQSSYLLYKVDQVIPELSEDYRGTGGASRSSYVAVCINSPPVIGIPCNSTTDQNVTYNCQLNATDSDGDGFNFSSEFIPTNDTLFNVSASGLVNFVPGNPDIGNYTINFSVADNSTCTGGVDWQLFNLTILNINDPPFLSLTIPDVTFNEGEQVSPFFLNNHFTDPDGDSMTYTVSGVDEATIVILPSSEVLINSTTCDFEDVVIFTAIDVFNLTGNSNAVTITCTADADDPTAGGGGGGGAGGGGGGGGLCRSNWECFDDRACTPENKKRQRCVDAEGCTDKIEFINVDCNYEYDQTRICEEDWLCGDWGECLLNNTQERECIDVNRCEEHFAMPPIVRACIYIPTCFDGVKNGNETGIDCGGDCPVCKKIDTPGPIQDAQATVTTLLIFLLLILLLTALVYRYGHKQIYSVLAKLGLHFAGRVPKEILLNEKERDDILEKLQELESQLETNPISELTRRFVDIMKSYFFHALGLEIDASKEDLLAKCEERKLNEHLTKVLASFFDKSGNIEFSTESLGGYELMYLIEELRELVIETSDYDRNVLKAEVTEYSIPEELYPLEKAHIMLVNSYIPLQFNELEEAVKHYMKILEYYETLSEQEKDIMYNDIGRLYQKIRYRAAWIQNM